MTSELARMEQGTQGDPEPGSLDSGLLREQGELQRWREVLEEGDGKKWRPRLCPTFRLEGDLRWKSGGGEC